MAWVIYFSVNFFTCFLGLLNVKQKKLLSLIVIINVLFFVGLRYKVGVDWAVYQDLFEGRSINVPFEPGYELLSNISSSTGMNFWFFVFLITSFLTLTLHHFYQKYSPLPAFSLAFYFILSFAFNIDFLRQILAVAITVWALIFYINNRKMLFFLAVFISSSLHVSALIFVIIPFINHRLFRNYATVLIAIGLLLAVIGQYPVDWVINILSSFIANPFIYKLKIYTLGSNISSVITANLLFKIVVLFLFILNRKRIEGAIEGGMSIYNFRLLTSIFYVMYIIDVYLGKYGPIRLRLDEYFAPVYILMMSYIIYSAKTLLAKQFTALLFIAYSIVNVAKFSQNDYFLKQFGYANSIIQTILPDRSYDKSRELSVKEHWAERDKIVVDDN